MSSLSGTLIQVTTSAHTNTHTHPFKCLNKSMYTIVVYASTESGRINSGIHGVGSEYRSNTVVLFQCCYSLFTDRAALKLERHERERGRDRKRGTNRYDILPVLFLRLCPADIIGSRVDKELQHLVLCSMNTHTHTHSKERLNK